jgi:hypothetical protein
MSIDVEKMTDIVAKYVIELMQHNFYHAYPEGYKTIDGDFVGNYLRDIQDTIAWKVEKQLRIDAFNLSPKELAQTESIQDYDYLQELIARAIIKPAIDMQRKGDVINRDSVRDFAKVTYENLEFNDKMFIQLFDEYATESSLTRVCDKRSGSSSGGRVA